MEKTTKKKFIDFDDIIENIVVMTIAIALFMVFAFMSLISLKLISVI